MQSQKTSDKWGKFSVTFVRDRGLIFHKEFLCIHGGKKKNPEQETTDSTEWENDPEDNSA